jgi:hypothetical protein
MGRGHKQYRTAMKCRTFNVRCQCKPGLVKVVTAELAMYIFDFSVVEEFRLSLVRGEQAVDFSWLF